MKQKFLGICLLCHPFKTSLAVLLNEYLLTKIHFHGMFLLHYLKRRVERFYLHVGCLPRLLTTGDNKTTLREEILHVHRKITQP